MGLRAERTPVERFVDTLCTDGAVVAVIDAVRHVLPGRVKDVPEIDFTFRCLRDYFVIPIRPRNALVGYRHGFLPRSADAYDYDRYGIDAYVSDFARTHHGWAINGAASAYLDDKRKFHELFVERGFERHLPRMYGRLEYGKLVGIVGGLAKLVHRQGKVVLKGRQGGGGNHVHLCQSERGRVLVDGVAVPDDQLETIYDEREYLVTEFCRSGSYVRSIFPDAVSTVRAITMNPAADEPFVANLTHKIGTERTAPMDTFGEGAISVHVDESGRFETGVRLEGSRLVPCTEHPDTGKPIPGTVIPEWETIRNELLTILDSVPELRYVGWDIVVGDDGDWRILEGNTNPGIPVQYHEPLLADERARRFYDEVGFRPEATPFDRLLDWAESSMVFITDPNRRTPP